MRNSLDNKLLSNFKLSPERNCNSQKSFQLKSRLKFSGEEINWRRIFSRRIFLTCRNLFDYNFLRTELFSADSNFEASRFSNRREKYSKLEINLLQLTKVKVENCNRHKLFKTSAEAFRSNTKFSQLKTCKLSDDNFSAKIFVPTQTFKQFSKLSDLRVRRHRTK